MPKLTIIEAGWKLGRSTSSIRNDIRLGDLEAEKIPGPGGFRYLVIFPDDEETSPEPALASDKEALAIDNELVKQLRADLDNASDRIRFLEGHISQLTNALPPAPPAPKPKSQSWWSKMWRGE